MQSSPLAFRSARVAVLVDGENIAADHAAAILCLASQHGTPLIRRVYGETNHVQPWAGLPEFRHVPSRQGRNAADLLLSVEAMGFVLRGMADILMIASADGDLAYLAENLRENGATVIGVGDAKAPLVLRHACSQFHDLPMGENRPVAIAACNSPGKDRLLPLVIETIRSKGVGGAIEIVKLNEHMARDHKVKIAATPEGNWRSWLTARPAAFSLEARGSQAKVRLA